MPLYEYKCAACGYEFEELAQKAEGAETMPCKKCKADAPRKMSAFAPVIAGGSTTESLDMAIGRQADQRWQQYGDKQSKRRAGRGLKVIDSVPKTSDGKFMPVMGIGNKADRSTRTEYTSALQEHRKERVKRGQPQIVGSGAF